MLVSPPSGATELAGAMWGSPTVAVAILDHGGVITAASPSLHQLAQTDPVGTSLASHVCEGHRTMFEAALAKRTGMRETGFIGMFPDRHGNVIDASLTITQGMNVEVLIEPHVANPLGMLADVVALNELLTHTQRELSAKNDELATGLDEIKKSHLYIRKLEGILPICMNCRSVRDDSDDWTSLDSYLVEREAVSLSHSLCPDCSESFLREEDVS